MKNTLIVTSVELVEEYRMSQDPPVTVTAEWPGSTTVSFQIAASGAPSVGTKLSVTIEATA